MHEQPAMIDSQVACCSLRDEALASVVTVALVVAAVQQQQQCVSLIASCHHHHRLVSPTQAAQHPCCPLHPDCAVDIVRSPQSLRQPQPVVQVPVGQTTLTHS
jgi:hypothetical protein